MTPSARDFEVLVHRAGDGAARIDRVATEEPLEIRLDGAPLAVVMRTPGDDLELAAGFLLAEGIVREADDLETLRHCAEATAGENVVDARLSPARRGAAEALLAARRAERATVTSASCGVCGKRTLEALVSQAPPFEAAPRVDAARVVALPSRLRGAQAVFELTGGLHGAAVFDAAGELAVCREDIGRHNAVDKCVGHLLLRERLPLAGAILMVSGRTSFEIVQKALAARIPTVAAVSAPSSLAVELARASRMALLGFVRDGGFNLYAGELAMP
jgi:FdhD protein